MIDHVSIAVRDLAISTGFYSAILSPLEFTLLVSRGATVGFGKKYPEFWLNCRPEHRPQEDPGAHVCLRAPDENAVSEFHRLAIAQGASDAGAPGPRQAAMANYYGAFIIDLDGNKIEAVTFPRKLDG